MKLILTADELLVVLRNGVDIELNGSGAYYPSKFEREYGSSDTYSITFELYTSQEMGARLYESLHNLDDPQPEEMP